MLPTYRPTEIAFVYAIAFFQGIGNIVFPASAAVFKSHHRFSDSDYGLLYLALIFFAILSSLAAAFLVRHISLKLILLIGIFGYAFSQAILALSYPMHSHALVLISISVLGIGFGFTGTAVNFYPTQFFPLHHDAAIIFVHVAFGIGATISPALLALAEHTIGWVAYPLLTALIMFSLATFSLTLPLQATVPKSSHEHTPSSIPFELWLFCAIAVLYALCEATFSNWAVIFLREAKGLSEQRAGLGLSVFWFALTVGRFAASVLARRIGAEKIYLALPLLMTLAFLLLPAVSGALPLLLCFSLAGLGCSAFFPLNVSLAMRYFPEHAATTGGLMSAFVMLGIGFASYGIAPLRAYFPLEQIYAFSALYPLSALLIAIRLVRKLSPSMAFYSS
jgi:fucose permease